MLSFMVWDSLLWIVGLSWNVAGDYGMGRVNMVRIIIGFCIITGCGRVTM